MAHCNSFSFSCLLTSSFRSFSLVREKEVATLYFQLNYLFDMLSGKYGKLYLYLFLTPPRSSPLEKGEVHWHLRSDMYRTEVSFRFTCQRQDPIQIVLLFDIWTRNLTLHFMHYQHTSFSCLLTSSFRLPYPSIRMDSSR